MAADPSYGTNSGSVYIPTTYFGSTLTSWERDAIKAKIGLENKDRHRDFISGKSGRPHYLKGWQR